MKNIQVWVGNQVRNFEFLGLDIADGSSNEEFEGQFPIGDITSDLFILVKEEYSVNGGENNFIGRVVIPISSYVTPKGSKPPTLEWMMIYPIVDGNVCLFFRFLSVFLTALVLNNLTATNGLVSFRVGGTTWVRNAKNET
jgi:hypothetical protein